MKRLVALLVAVGLVAGAWYLRTNVIDGDDEDDGPSGDVPTLVCATEVRAACEELDDVEVLAVEEPGVTYDRLVNGGDLEADGWLVSQPWPAMAASLDRLEGTTSDVLARTPLQLAIVDPPPSNLNCDPTGWKCLGDYAIAGGTFAHDTRDATAGFLTQHALAAGYIGTTDYAKNDFAEVEGFAQWFSQVESAVDDTRRSGDLLTTLQTARGSYTAVSALGALVDLNAGFDALTPTPEITADVVLAGHPDRFDTGDISDALFATGWLRFDDNALSATNGLPKPGVMVALRAISR